MKDVLVGVIMGSDSDLPIMKEALDMLDELEISFEVMIVSAHRTPEFMYKYAKEAEKRGLKLIIAGAGGSAHLPGMVASLTNLPVIGVPIKSKSLDGLDSLYSIVQMPPGIPVATMGINGAKNAGILAGKILASFDKSIMKNIDNYSKSLEKIVTEKNNKLINTNYKDYLKDMKYK